MPPTRSRFIGSFAFISATVLLPPPAQGSTIGDQASARPVESSLTLESALQSALLNNFDLLREDLRVGIADSDLTQARAAFDPSQSVNGTVRQDGSGDASDRNRERTVSTTTSKPFPTGTRLDATVGMTQEPDTEDDPWRSSLAIALRQPLLEGAGRFVNTAEILQRDRDLNAAQLAFEARALDVLANTAAAYWRLSFQEARRAVLQLSLDIARDLLDEAVARRDLGVATEIDVLRAQSGVADREEALIILDQQIGDATDALFTTIGILQEATPPRIEVSPLPEKTPPPPIDPEESYRLARAFDPDLKIRRLTLQNRETDFELARNRSLPNLDLVASGSLRGDDGVAPGAFDAAFQGDDYSWAVGVEIQFPWTGRADRARTDRARFNRTLAAIDVEDRAQDLTSDLRDSWRQIQSSLDLIEIRRIAVDLEEKTFAEEQARFEEGLSIFRDVAEEQRELDLARLDLLQAQLDLILAAIQLERLTGTLPSRFGLDWQTLHTALRIRP